MLYFPTTPFPIFMKLCSGKIKENSQQLHKTVLSAMKGNIRSLHGLGDLGKASLRK